ncbi:HD domain-containing protein [Undibacterium sp. Tian12W]|uniref:HD domain-containing protein n=1 Tax=Undibacterium sp. Tian12W TaxID=3413054 RepID=UPI003BF0405C
MNIENIEATALWRTAFSESNLLKHRDHCERLRTEFLKFRNKIESLVGKISEVLPGLTVHDISHLDGLWGVADIVAGKDYPLNPLEAFILGGAILLHDSAMCWEAYTSGKDGVRKTIEWKDAYAVECDRAPDVNKELWEAAADFSALRALHAHQASSLATKGWVHPDTGQSIYLIDDFELRQHIGELTGKIASSHHWDIDLLSSKLGDQYNAPAGLPPEWQVDPVKIACLLRCADAAHINHSRAPDFLYALTRRSGISKLHWQAQNKMMGPSLDNGDPSGETILYTSSNPYPIETADAWWIAFDAISVVDSEIHASNMLLNNRNRPNSAPEFKIKKIKGANSIFEIAKLLHAQDWVPCSARIHVSNIESLVKNLGGEKLYGEGTDTTEVVVRELIQNARDAIVARQIIDEGYIGTIEIKVRTINDESWLIFEDDGIGMSYDVLTGSLLDFGTSFWKSVLVQKEFPGLRSSKFKSIGRFGIGFYSAFMIANSVTVISRRFDKGIDEANTLIFNNGITFRPIVKTGKPSNFNFRTSTQVRLKLKNGIIKNQDDVTIHLGILGVPNIHPKLHDYLAAIVAGLDVCVSFESPTFPKKIIHEAFNEATTNGATLLTKLSLVEYEPDGSSCEEYIANNARRLRPIKSDGYTVGFAAISTHAESDRFRLGMRTIGGLATSVHGGYAAEYIGFLNFKPRSAKRDAIEIDASQEAINEWFQEQIDILELSSFNDFERCVVAANASALNIDPLQFGRLLIAPAPSQMTIASYKEIALMAETVPIVIFKSKYMDHAETYHKISCYENKVLILPIRNGNYLSLEFENGAPKNSNSIIGCLHRAVISSGKNPVWTTSISEYQGRFGEMEELTLIAV